MRTIVSGMSRTTHHRALSVLMAALFAATFLILMGLASPANAAAPAAPTLNSAQQTLVRDYMQSRSPELLPTAVTGKYGAYAGIKYQNSRRKKAQRLSRSDLRAIRAWMLYRGDMGIKLYPSVPCIAEGEDGHDPTCDPNKAFRIAIVIYRQFTSVDMMDQDDIRAYRSYLPHKGNLQVPELIQCNRRDKSCNPFTGFTNVQLAQLKWAAMSNWSMMLLNVEAERELKGALADHFRAVDHPEGHYSFSSYTRGLVSAFLGDPRKATAVIYVLRSYLRKPFRMSGARVVVYKQYKRSKKPVAPVVQRVTVQVNCEDVKRCLRGETCPCTVTTCPDPVPDRDGDGVIE